MLPFKRFEVRGHSMQPEYNPGDKVLVNRWAYLFSNPKKGDIVAFYPRNNRTRLLLKKVERTSKRSIFVFGINSNDSLDSRKIGNIENKDVVGKVLLHYS